MNEQSSAGSAWSRVYLSLIMTAVACAIVAAINALVNPYRAWSIDMVDRLYIRTDGLQRVTVPYLLTTTRPRVVLVGSSRVMFGMPIEQGERDGILNAGLPAASLDEIAVVVDAARRQPALQRVVWSVDYFTFAKESGGIRDAKMHDRLRRDPLQLARETLLSLDALHASGKALGRSFQGPAALPPSRRASLPWPPSVVAEAIARDWDSGLSALDSATRALMNEWIPAYAYAHLSTERWEVFRAIVSRLAQDGIEVLLFVGPLSLYELELMEQSGHWESFVEWKRQLALVQPFWDFSGYDPVATDEHFYLDPVHYQPFVGHLILRHLLEGDCRDCGPAADALLAAGARVDPINVEAHVGLAAADRARYRDAGGSVAREVAALLSKPVVSTHHR